MCGGGEEGETALNPVLVILDMEAVSLRGMVGSIYSKGADVLVTGILEKLLLLELSAVDILLLPLPLPVPLLLQVAVVVVVVVVAFDDRS